MLTLDSGLDTVISGAEDRHLRWRQEGNAFLPEYTKRVNRQQLPHTFRETGAVVACRRETLTTGSRIGNAVKIYPLPTTRSIDIDDLTDFWLCERLMERKKVVLAVAGNRTIGMGHVYRSLMIAHELISHEVAFVCFDDDILAQEYISRHNYPVVLSLRENLLETVLAQGPNLLINDILDTSADYVVAMKQRGVAVVNFEDMGLGAEVADLVVNALYPHQLPSDHILVGPRYFCLRDEFLHLPRRKQSDAVTSLLITFGGVDEGDLTGRVLETAGEALRDSGIAIDVVLGPGYAHHERLEEMRPQDRFPNVTIIKSTQTISTLMARADLAVTSAGRTVLELASVGVPTIVIAQNPRELTHTIASSEYGIINLGLRTEVSDDTIGSTIRKVIADEDLRRAMHKKMKNVNLRDGKQEVVGRILQLLDRKRSQR